MFAITSIALSGLCLILRLLPDILRKRTADVVRFLKLTFVVTAHVALVGAGIDELTLGQ